MQVSRADVGASPRWKARAAVLVVEQFRGTSQGRVLTAGAGMARSFPEADKPLCHDLSSGLSEKARSLCRRPNCAVVDSVAQEECREGLPSFQQCIAPLVRLATCAMQREGMRKAQNIWPPISKCVHRKPIIAPEIPILEPPGYTITPEATGEILVMGAWMEGALAPAGRWAPVIVSGQQGFTSGSRYRLLCAGGCWRCEVWTE